MRSFRRVWWLPGMLAATLLGACGGGGGGGDGGDDGVVYAGKTTPVTITEQNADIVVDGLAGGVPTALDLSSGGGLFKTGPGEAANQGGLSMRNLGGVLWDRVGLALWPGEGRVAERRVRDSMPGSCGGSASFDFDVNDETGAFGGTIRFSSDYCEEDVRMGGDMSVSGQVDVYAEELLWMEMSTGLLTVRDPDPLEPTDVSMTGTIRLDDLAGAITLDVSLRDNLAQEVVKFQGFRVGYEDGFDSTTVTVTGRYYDPAEGYVDFQTEQPLVLAFSDDGPSSGVVTALGANGTKSRLTVLTAETYRIDADLNGNGAYDDPGDYTSGILNWSDL